jgi:hypothetical protein
MPENNPATSFVAWESSLDLDQKRPDLGDLSLAELAAIPFESLGRFNQAQSSPMAIAAST